MSDKCCTTDETANTAASHVLRGRTHHVDGMPPLYISGSLPSARVIVCAPDIFGVIPVSMRFIDDLSRGNDPTLARVVCFTDATTESGIPVVVVDHFRGKPWLPENFPPREGQNIRAWIAETVPTELVLKDFDAVAAWLRAEHGVKTLGHLGFCWGGRYSVEFARLGHVTAAASAHPSFVTAELATEAAARASLCLLPSKGEDVAIYEAIAAVLAGDARHVYKRYDTMEHGWCGARAKYDDAHVAAQIDDARGVISRFFAARL